MMNNKTLIAAAVSAMFLLAPLQANATSLLQAYQAALNNDPTFKAARAAKVAGAEYASIGRAGLLPQIQYSYSTNKNKGESIEPNILNQRVEKDLNYRSSSNSLSIRQPLFNIDSYARFEQGKAQTRVSEAQFDSKSADLVVRVVSAYAEANFAQDQVNLYTAQRDTLFEQRKVNDRLFAKGEGTKTDMLETQAKLDSAEALLLEANDGLQGARNALAGITGIDFSQVNGLSSTFQTVPVIGTIESWKDTAQKNNPDILAARHNVEVSNQEMTKARANHAPRLEMNATYSHGMSESVQTRNQDNSTRSVGIQLVVPIYSGGYASAVSKQAVAHLDQAKAELDTTSMKVILELRKQFDAVKSSIVKIEAMQKAVSSSTLLVEAMTQSVKAGIRINLDMINAQQQLVTAKRDLASARYGYLLSFLKLRVAAGIVNDDDVRTISAYFSATN
jgi:protease secretion system outer membrane protein